MFDVELFIRDDERGSKSFNVILDRVPQVGETVTLTDTCIPCMVTMVNQYINIDHLTDNEQNSKVCKAMYTVYMVWND